MFIQKRKHRSKAFKYLCSVSLISVFLSGCRDFSNVKQLGDTWEVIDKTSSIISDDFYQSCLRTSKHPASAKLFGTTDYFNAVKIEKEKCEKNDLLASNSISNTYSVYIEYLRKLSILADKRTGAITSAQKDELQSAIENLVSQLEATKVKVPTILSENIGTGVNILAIIFGIIGNNIRRQAILPTIVCTDDEIRHYTDGLMAISSTVYINQLSLERSAYESHIANFNPKIDKNLTISDSRNLFEMENLLVAKDTSLDEREMVARSFSNVLNRTANTHAGLSKIFAEELKLTDKVKKDEFCAKYENTAAANIKTSQDKSISISPSASAKATKLLTSYQAEVKPFVKFITSSKVYKDSIK